MDNNRNNVNDKFEVLVNVCSVILPFTTLPQLYVIFVDKNAQGVSPITWLLYGILTIPLFIYSVKRKEIPMVILNGLWIIMDFIVALGAFIY